MSNNRKHALLSPSAAHRWLNCTPSARLCEDISDTSSTYAQEGSCAHDLAEYKLLKFLGEKVKDPREHLTYYDQDMESHTDDYLHFCVTEYERLSENGKPQMYIEQRVRYEDYVPQGSGSADCVIIGNGEMVVCDFKYGAGIQVEAEENPQLKLYSIGCLLAFDGIYDIKTVKMCIFQPRREHISETTVFKESLYQWAEEIVKPAAELAWDGEGEQCAGSWCQFCGIKAQCRTRAEANMALAAYDFKDPPLLEHSEIAAILDQSELFKNWIKDVEAFALTEALKGTKFPGYKIVEGRSNRKYTDEAAVGESVKAIGLDPYEHKILGVTAMTALLGKKRFEETLNGLIHKPQGKPTLVPETDKRKEITVNSAADDFNDDFADHEN